MRRQPARLSDSLSHRLNSYALAASAAGVGVLALSLPAQAKVVYHPVHHMIGTGRHYRLDLNQDGAPDFLIVNSSTNWNTYYAFRTLQARPANLSNAVGLRAVGEESLALALKPGARIGSNHSIFFYGQVANMVEIASNRCTSSCTRGYWAGVSNRYLGLLFEIHGKVHYGWARLSVEIGRPLQLAVTLTGYAYETVPNKPIIAGKTKGPDVITVQPGSLGHLARGSSAIPTWRMKQ
jgi:hypothetical protein